MNNLLKVLMLSFVSILMTSSFNLFAADIVKNTRRIVILNNNVNSNDMASEVAKEHRVAKGHVYKHAINGFAISLPDAAVARLAKDKRVKYVVDDKPKKISSIPSGVRRIGADKNATALINADGGNVDVDVAVIDTGIDLSHPKLNVFASANFAKGKSADDGHGHGTHVAGTIAGIDDGSGTVGIAPGARLWAVRVLDNRGSGWTSDIVAGLDYVRANADKIEVANMSLGGSGSDDGNCGLTNNDPEHTAICAVVNAGVVVVVAAGNESDDAANHTPAAYDEVITVSAVGDTDGLPGGLGANTSRGTADDALADFSNFGADVDIAAPGVDIFSTYKGDSTTTMSGTSMAAPHVAGAVALYIAHNGRAYDAAGTQAIQAGLIALADAQKSYEGFTGDNDGFEEPMLNAERINPMSAPIPAVKVSVSSDKSEYNTAQGDSSAKITSIVKDENGNSLSGLNAADFSCSLNGVASSCSFTEISSGIYEASFDISTLVDGSYNFSVSAYDSSRDLSGIGSTNFTKTSIIAPPTPKLFVNEIGYRLTGGNRNLLIDVSVGNTNGGVEADASVTINLFRDGALVGSGTALTGSNGVVTFQLRNASKGYYTTSIVDVSKSGFEYDSSLNANDPGFTK